MFHCKWDLAEKIALRIYSKELERGKKESKDRSTTKSKYFY